MYIRWNYIEDEMKIKKISNKDIAEKLNISRDTWCRYKRSEGDISLRTFYKLLQILDLKFDDVIKENDLSQSVDELLNIFEYKSKLSDNIKKFNELNKDKPKSTTKFNTDKIKK